MISDDTEPVWLTIARGEFGTAEVAGDGDNPRVLEYLATTRLPEAKVHDVTPWCSAFVNWCFAKAKMDCTHSASARSWLRWGVPLEHPRVGCVAVLSRAAAGPGSGHVGFYVGCTADEVLLLGGNQGNRVSQRLYARSRVIEYRWPG